MCLSPDVADADGSESENEDGEEDETDEKMVGTGPNSFISLWC